MKINGFYPFQLSNTLLKFRKHKRSIITRGGIDPLMWNAIKKSIIKHTGPFNANETYCGPGDIGDIVIPDFIFKFAGYVHDGMYRLIELGILDETKGKESADKIFYIIMDDSSTNGFYKFLSVVYYKAVDIFGNPKKEE